MEPARGRAASGWERTADPPAMLPPSVSRPHRHSARVRQLTAADAVEHDQDDAVRNCHAQSGFGRGVVIAHRPGRPNRGNGVLENHVIGATVLDDHSELVEIFTDPRCRSRP